MYRQELVKNDHKCIFCGEHVDQYDATAGGADSDYSRGAAGEFDYPVTVECECGACYCDGDYVGQRLLTEMFR